MNNNYDDLFTSTATKNVNEEMLKDVKADENLRQKAYDMIGEALESIRRDTGKLSTLLNVMSRFGNFSLGNMLLIYLQMPNAEKFDDLANWAAAGIKVRKGEKGFVLLTREKEYIREINNTSDTYYARMVYDVSQTDSVYTYVCRYTSDRRELVKSIIEQAPVPIMLKEGLEKAALFVPEEQTIYVRPNTEAEIFIPNLIKELTHANIYYKNDDANYDYDRHNFTAKCVSFIVSDRIGIRPREENVKIPEYVLQNRTTLQTALALIRRLSSKQTQLINSYFEK